MKDLKLGQIIYVTTTWYDGPNQIFKLEKTTLTDAREHSVRKGTIIEMGRNHNWGACPTRSRNEVVANCKDIEKIVESSTEIQKARELVKDKSGNYLYVVKLDSERQEISMRRYTYQGITTSLREGSFKAYSSRTSVGEHTLKLGVDFKLPKGHYDDLELAIQNFKELLRDEFDSNK